MTITIPAIIALNTPVIVTVSHSREFRGKVTAYEYTGNAPDEQTLFYNVELDEPVQDIGKFGLFAAHRVREIEHANLTDYESEYEIFWKSLVTNPDGSLNLDQIKRELYDYSTLMTNVGKLYYELTDGQISKSNTDTIYIIDAVDKRIKEAVKEALEE